MEGLTHQWHSVAPGTFCEMFWLFEMCLCVQRLSDFAVQVLEDHPGLSVAEAKVAADTPVRCVDYVTQHEGTGSSSSRPA